MISRKQFDESSHWHLRSPRGGNISISWLKREDGSFTARLIQYASVVDKNYKAVQTRLGPENAYDRVIAAIGRFIDPIITKHLAKDAEAIVPIHIGMLPSDKNPFELQLGTGKAGNGFLVASRSAPDRVMIVTTPETQYDPGKRAVFIEIEKSAGGWNEVPLSRELIETAKGYYAPWMRNALSKMAAAAEAPSFAA